MKGLHYEQISEEAHRVSFNYQILSLSQTQEEKLHLLLNGPAKRGFGLGVNCIVEKDELGRIARLDFRNKELAHHFLLFIETELADMAKDIEPRRGGRSLPCQIFREESVGV